jgi:UDP-glucose 4-epimerase
MAVTARSVSHKLAAFSKMTSTILVTGGAGYIGSHAVRLLLENDYRVLVLDNLSLGHRAAVQRNADFAQVDLASTNELIRLMRRYAVTSVLHFAALANVGDSVACPLQYYANNTAGTLSLLQAMDEARVKRLVFSSTCATYGIPAVLPITESTPQSPINPYGWSKRFVEQILIDKANADPEFACTVLRYFNVAGCAEDGSLGEDHDPETHLIPLVLQTALGVIGRRKAVTVFGTDYPTPDGTCIRDYVHVEDLCRAHLLALGHLEPGTPKFYNAGIGRGYSVREVIEAARRVTGHEIPLEEAPRRPGDPPELWAQADRLRHELGWSPRFTRLDEIIATAWQWFRSKPNGYPRDTPEGLDL